MITFKERQLKPKETDYCKLLASLGKIDDELRKNRYIRIISWYRKQEIGGYRNILKRLYEQHTNK